jgi:hypothetical protein
MKMVDGKWKHITKDPEDPSASRKFTEIQGYFVDGVPVGGIAKTVDEKWNARGRQCHLGPAQKDLEELGKGGGRLAPPPTSYWGRQCFPWVT